MNYAVPVKCILCDLRDAVICGAFCQDCVDNANAEPRYGGRSALFAALACAVGRYSGHMVQHPVVWCVAEEDWSYEVTVHISGSSLRLQRLPEWVLREIENDIQWAVPASWKVSVV